MFLTRSLGVRSSLWKRCFLLNSSIRPNSSYFRKYTGLTYNIFQSRICTCNGTSTKEQLFTTKLLYGIENRKYYSKVIDYDLTELQRSQHENELKKLSQLFPQPRVTLNEFATKVPQKIFDIHYKQHMVAHRKKIAQGDWVCTYAFVWPEKMKFESKAISKRQAAEKAATQALNWLYNKKRIDNKGNPVYGKEVLDELRDVIDQPIKITVSDKTKERIEKIWNEYETGIKPIYEAVLKNAAQKAVNIPVLSKDSTLDDDEFSDDEIEPQEIAAPTDSKPHMHPVYGKIVKKASQATLLRRKNVLEQKFEQYDEELTPLPIDTYAENKNEGVGLDNVPTDVTDNDSKNNIVCTLNHI